MQATREFKTNAEAVTKVNGYQLTTALLRGGLAELKLNNATGLVLLYLASCYNGGVIYPKVNTIADNVGISAISVKRAIAELLKTNCIMKSKRHNGTNANCYVLTQKILSMYHGDTNKGIKMILSCMKSNHNKLEQQHDEVAVFSNNSDLKGVKGETSKDMSRTAMPVSSETHQFDLDEIPDIIKNKKDIRNVKRYWGSLRREIKIEYWQEQAEIDEKKRKRVEYERAEEERKAKERAEREAYDRLPLNEKFPKPNAIKHIWCLRNLLAMKGYQVSGLSADLVALYDLDVRAICRMSEDEVKQICL